MILWSNVARESTNKGKLRSDSVKAGCTRGVVTRRTDAVCRDRWFHGKVRSADFSSVTHGSPFKRHREMSENCEEPRLPVLLRYVKMKPAFPLPCYTRFHGEDRFAGRQPPDRKRTMQSRYERCE